MLNCHGKSWYPPLSLVTISHLTLLCQQVLSLRLRASLVDDTIQDPSSNPMFSPPESRSVPLAQQNPNRSDKHKKQKRHVLKSSRKGIHRRRRGRLRQMNGREGVRMRMATRKKRVGKDCMGTGTHGRTRRSSNLTSSFSGQYPVLYVSISSGLTDPLHSLLGTGRICRTSLTESCWQTGTRSIF